MTLIYTLADQRNRELSDRVAAKDIVRRDEVYGRDALVVAKGHRIPKGLDVEDDEVEKPKRQSKKDTTTSENKSK